MHRSTPLVAAALLVPLVGVALASVPADGQQFKVVYLNNRIGELNPCG